jgi:hypothetical protein
MDELEALFAAIDYRVVIGRHPSGFGWQWCVLGGRRPPPDVWDAIERHAEAIVASEAYLAWLGQDREAGAAAVDLAVIPDR